MKLNNTLNVLIMSFLLTSGAVTAAATGHDGGRGSEPGGTDK